MRWVVAAALALALAAGAPAGADETELERAERLAGAAATRLRGALGALLRAVPQYEAPEILDNGDIVIRRKRPEAAPAEPPTGRPAKREPMPDVTETRS